MIRIQSKDGKVRTMGGGDPKLKIALPPIAQPLEARAIALRQAETKVASIVSCETKVSGKMGRPSKGKPWQAAGMSRAAWYRKAQGAPPAQG